MKKITLWVAVAGLAFAGVAKADTFDFSYTFSDGGVVNGALQGTLDGNFVDNVSNVTMSYISADQTVNITEPTPIYIYQEETVSNAITWVSGAVVSFDPTQNNFDFTTQPVPPFSSVNTDCFFMLPTGNTLEDSGPGNPYAEYYLNGSI